MGVSLAVAGTNIAFADDATEAKALARRFATTLQGELQTALADGGPAVAVEVCRTRAPAIAARLTEESGWRIGRVSLKPRNGALNAPDEWERRVLRQFEDRRAAGADSKTLTYAEVTTQNGRATYRFMQAIPTAAACLMCHGATLTPEVAQALDAAYPGDRARGYQAGELRGAFTLSKTR